MTKPIAWCCRCRRGSGSAASRCGAPPSRSRPSAPTGPSARCWVLAPGRAEADGHLVGEGAGVQERVVLDRRQPLVVRHVDRPLEREPEVAAAGGDLALDEVADVSVECVGPGVDQDVTNRGVLLHLVGHDGVGRGDGRGHQDQGECSDGQAECVRDPHGGVPFPCDPYLGNARGNTIPLGDR